MKISVITVCFNSQNTIKRTILSVLNQSYENIEYIIVDGGSNDNTIKIIKEFSNEISYFISEKDNGIYDAINKGINIASGDYILILSSNDFFYSNSTIQKIVDFHTIHNCSISIADVIYCDSKGVISRYYSANFWKPFLLKLGFMPPHQASVIKTSLYKKLGGYSLNYKIASDYDIFVRFLLDNKIHFQYANEIRIVMSVGGISSQGFSSYLLITKEILKILDRRINFLFSLLIYFRFGPKVISSFISRARFFLTKFI